jgi:hypothetical protein
VITFVVWAYNNVHIHTSANQYPLFPASFIEGLCCPLCDLGDFVPNQSTITAWIYSGLSILLQWL